MFLISKGYFNSSLDLISIFNIQIVQTYNFVSHIRYSAVRNRVSHYVAHGKET